LEGRNPATLAIVAREKERARQKGLTFEEDLDGVLSVFHVDEKAIFERLSEDNWKESRYERLAQRELPDI
jgi:TBC1 domain family member 14